MLPNVAAAFFARSLEEMGYLCEQVGGKRETALGGGGSGDLFVTVLAGRNGRLGQLWGGGKAPSVALSEMKTTVEGYHLAQKLASPLRTYLSSKQWKAEKVSLLVSLVEGLVKDKSFDFSYLK